MSDSWLIAIVVLLVLARLSSLRRLWRLPQKQGANWFLTTEVGPGFYQGEGARLLRRFRGWLLAPYALDAALISLLITTDRAFYIIHEQVVMNVFAAIFKNLVVYNFSYRAKAFAAPGETKPATAAQLMIEPRRLRDHTDWRIETALLSVIVASVALSLVYRKPMTLGLVWLFYIQVGLLLLKQVFVRWRMKLPLRRTEDYRRWRAAWLNYHLRIFDAVRLLVAVMFIYLVIQTVFEAAFERMSQAAWAHPVRISAWALIMLFFIVYCSREARRLLVVEREVQPMTLVKEFPPTPVAEGRFFAGGLLYFNPDNPVAIARSPQGIALNLASRSAYLWVAYLTGLVVLAAWQIIKS